MGDDIVTRLRNWHDQRDSWQTLTEAADEIERLRDERDKWQIATADLMEHLENALYSDEWRTREYAIAMFSTVEEWLPHWRNGRVTEFER